MSVHVEHKCSGILLFCNPFNLSQCAGTDAHAVVFGQQIEFVQFYDAVFIRADRDKADHCIVIPDGQPGDTLMFDLIKDDLAGVAAGQHVIDLFSRDDAGVVGMPDTVGQGQQRIDVLRLQGGEGYRIHRQQASRLL